MLSMGSISATEILNMIYLSGDKGILGICIRLGWLPLALLTLTLNAEVTGLDGEGWVILIGWATPFQPTLLAILKPCLAYCLGPLG